MGKLYQIYREQVISSSIEKTWKFFSNPQNLKIITPDYMNFRILTKNLPEEIFQGLIIEYKVSPLFKIDFYWVTEITAVEKYRYFIDEQRFGPYKFWYHIHIFEEIEKNRIKIIDHVYYLPPFGFLGRIANSLIIRNRLEDIFNYRQRVISSIFSDD